MQMKICTHLDCSPAPAGRRHGLQMVVSTMNDDAKQDDIERAALPEDSTWPLALTTLAIDPHGQQRALIQREVSFACGHTLPGVAAGSTRAAIGLYDRLTQNTSLLMGHCN